MQLTAVTCNQCGGSLELSDSVRFATCRYCGANLEVKRNESAVFTEVLSKINRDTSRTAENVEVIRWQNEIERLDREWQMRREGLMIRGRGGPTVPSTAAGIVVAVFAGVVGMVFIIIGAVLAATVAKPLVIMCVMGLLFASVGIFAGVYSANKAGAFRREEAAYLQRRAQLIFSYQNAMKPKR